MKKKNRKNEITSEQIEHHLLRAEHVIGEVDVEVLNRYLTNTIDDFNDSCFDTAARTIAEMYKIDDEGRKVFLDGSVEMEIEE